MVKKLPDSRSLYFYARGARICRDDIEDLIHLLEQSSFRVAIGSGGYAYESLDELKDRKGECPGTVVLAAERPDKGSVLAQRVTIEMGKDINIHSLAGPNVLREVYYELLAFGRKVRLLYVPLWFTFIVLAPVFVAVVALAGNRPKYWGPVAGLELLVLIEQGAVFLFRGTYLRYRHAGGFFKRNGDRILTGIITGATGVGLGWVLNTFLGRTCR